MVTLKPIQIKVRKVWALVGMVHSLFSLYFFVNEPAKVALLCLMESVSGIQSAVF